jgi:hypothetical protein
MNTISVIDQMAGPHQETADAALGKAPCTGPPPLVRELLEALRDAINGHKSLLEDGEILHWDISKNNIIITEAAVEGNPRGMLIGLDLAKKLDNLPIGTSHQTGTMQFMAIEVLQGKIHTYQHDLESFFYVFI